MNTHTASAIAHAAFWCFAAVAIYSMARCEASVNESRGLLECVKQRGEWRDGNCMFERKAEKD